VASLFAPPHAASQQLARRIPIDRALLVMATETASAVPVAEPAVLIEFARARLSARCPDCSDGEIRTWRRVHRRPPKCL
jgi:hypothetical protein